MQSRFLFPVARCQQQLAIRCICCRFDPKIFSLPRESEIPLDTMCHWTLNVYLSNGIYAVGHKNVPLYFCPYLRQLLTDFQNSFTGTLYRQFALV